MSCQMERFSHNDAVVGGDLLLENLIVHLLKLNTLF